MWQTWLALIIVVVAGFAVRWMSLLQVPAFTDEMDDVLYALPVLLGAPVPLTNFDTFNGGLYTGLIGAALQALNLNWVAPRLVSWLAGGLTVGASYALGRACGGHVVGLVTALLVALTPAHILINSRVAWSHSLTPLFTTGALAFLTAAAGRRYLLALPAGILAGFALQSHASTIALLPGAIPSLWAVSRFPRAGRWLILAGLLMCLIEGPVLYYNVTSGFESFEYAQQHRRLEDRTEPLTVTRYANNLGMLLLAVAETLGGSLTDRDQTAVPTNPVTNAAGIAIALIGTTGLIVSRRWLLLGCGLVFIGVLPFLNSRYLPTVMNARYVMPLIPIVLTGFALLFARLFGRAHRALARVGLLSVLAALLALPLWGLSLYVQSAIDRHLTTDPPQEITDALASRQADQIILDEGLNASQTLGGGRLLKSLMVLLSLQSRSYQVVSVTGLPDVLDLDIPRYAVLTPATVSALRAQPERLTLQRVFVSRQDPGGPGVYRLSGLTAQAPTSCVSGTVQSFSRRADGATEIGLNPSRTLIIDATAKASSVSLRELDRVQRPIGLRMKVCTLESDQDASRGEIAVRTAQQILYLPIRTVNQ